MTIFKITPLLLAASISFSLSPAFAALTVSAPVISATKADISQGAAHDSSVDGPVTQYPGGAHYLGSHFYHGGAITHVLSKGNQQQAYTDIAWVKNTCKRVQGFCVNSSNTGQYAFTSFADGLDDVHQLWFVDLYWPNDIVGPEIIAIVHEERVGNSNGEPSGGFEDNQEGLTRIGLAYSNDWGNTWKYLGRIISPHTDLQPFNIQGAPYVIKNNYMYVYYKDVDADGDWGIGVSRAFIPSIVGTARQGHVGNNVWKKYHNGAFTQPGLGGIPTWPSHTGTKPFWGINHSQAIHSSYDNKFYTVLTSLSWGIEHTFVWLFSSVDGVSWHFEKTIIEEPHYTQGAEAGGYMYCSLNGTSGQINHKVDDRFLLSCAKLSQAAFGDEPEYHAMYTWTVDLNQTSQFNKKSKDYSGTTQGPDWRNQNGVNGSITDMTSAGDGSWVGVDSVARIFKGSVSPTMNVVPTIKWVAPQSGTVKLSTTVYDRHPGCGDGVTAQIVTPSQQIFLEKIEEGDTVGKSISTDFSVSVGDSVFFMVGADGNPYCDSTAWDPSFEYQ